jgi:hypothetical protein
MQNDIPFGLRQIKKIVIEAGINDYRIQSFDSSCLLIIGSFDISYYHDLEIELLGVSHINLPVYFDGSADISIEEDARSRHQIDQNETYFRINDNGSMFHVVAEGIEVRKVKVFHYARQNLKDGERIAPWVKLESD